MLMLRRAFQDATLPLAEPMMGSNGTVIDSIPIPKGSNVLVGVRACNRHKALWGDDAEEWKPERWLKPLPKTVENANIPGVYSNMWVIRPVFSMAYSNVLSSSRMTFVGGGRSCM